MRKVLNARCLGSICAGIFCLLLVSCKQETPQAPIQEYLIESVKTDNRTLTTLYSATIRGKQDIDIFPQVSGFITKLCVEEGQSVRKGQVLFIIDQVPYQAALQTAKANLESAEVALRTAKLTYDSKKELHAQNVVSSFDLQTAENAWLGAKAQVAQMNALLLAASNNYSYTEVKSPVNGVVGTLPYRVGTLVSPNSPQPLTSVSDNSEMYVYFSMNEKQLLSLTRQYGSKTKALEEMPNIHLVLNDNSTYSHTGKIETISGLIDKNTGTVSLRAVFPNQEGLLFSGGSGNIVLPEKREGCIVIPQSATYEIQDKRYVYKLVDGKASSSLVKVTPVNGGVEFIVEEGLASGDEIVMEGAGLLREGMPIAAKGKSQKETSTNS